MPYLAKNELKLEDLPKHEWLFSDRKELPDEETVAAYYWELGIETPEVIAEVKELRKQQTNPRQLDVKAIEKWCSSNTKPKGDPERRIDWMRRFRNQFPNVGGTAFHDFDAQFLTSWPEFPSQHWLQISEEIRKHVDEKRFRPRPGQLVFGKGLKNKESIGWFDTVPATFFKTQSGFGCNQISLLKGLEELNYLFKYVPTTKTPYGIADEDRWTEYRLVSFSWARSDRKLKADFVNWLKENRPDDRQPYHKSREDDSRRTTERDLLKALGAMRLLRHFKGNWNKAAEYSENFCVDKRGNPKPLYVEQSEWRDAKKRATEALSEFYRKVFG